VDTVLERVLAVRVNVPVNVRKIWARAKWPSWQEKQEPRTKIQEPKKRDERRKKESKVVTS
jgi:hypothetical protein